MKKNSFCYIRRIAILIIYLAILSYGLFFSEYMGRTGGREFSYNLIPFKEILRYIIRAGQIGSFSVLMNLFGNIIAFIPLGMIVSSLIPDCHKKSAWVVGGLCAAFSVAVELLQFFSKTGCCDIDDVILNSTGGLLGFVIFCAIHHHLDQKKENMKGECL